MISWRDPTRCPSCGYNGIFMSNISTNNNALFWTDFLAHQTLGEVDWLVEASGALILKRCDYLVKMEQVQLGTARAPHQ